MYTGKEASRNTGKEEKNAYLIWGGKEFIKEEKGEGKGIWRRQGIDVFTLKINP